MPNLDYYLKVRQAIRPEGGIPKRRVHYQFPAYVDPKNMTSVDRAAYLQHAREVGWDRAALDWETFKDEPEELKSAVIGRDTQKWAEEKQRRADQRELDQLENKFKLESKYAETSTVEQRLVDTDGDGVQDTVAYIRITKRPDPNNPGQFITEEKFEGYSRPPSKPQARQDKDAATAQWKLRTLENILKPMFTWSTPHDPGHEDWANMVIGDVAGTEIRLGGARSVPEAVTKVRQIIAHSGLGVNFLFQHDAALSEALNDSRAFDEVHAGGVISNAKMMIPSQWLLKELERTLRKALESMNVEIPVVGEPTDGLLGPIGPFSDEPGHYGGSEEPPMFMPTPSGYSPQAGTGVPSMNSGEPLPWPPHEGVGATLPGGAMVKQASYPTVPGAGKLPQSPYGAQDLLDRLFRRRMVV